MEATAGVRTRAWLTLRCSKDWKVHEIETEQWEMRSEKETGVRACSTKVKELHFILLKWKMIGDISSRDGRVCPGCEMLLS